MSASRTPDHPVDPQFFQRWSPRAFTGEALDRASLMTVLEAARWAPSSFNSQPWRFIYGLAGTPAFDAIFGALAPVNQSWTQRAGALVLLVSRTKWIPPNGTELAPLGSAAFDTGAAWMSIALQAEKMSLKAHAIGGYDRDAMRAALQVPADHALHAVVALGRQGPKDVLTPDQQAREAPNARQPLAKLVAEGRFSFD